MKITENAHGSIWIFQNILGGNGVAERTETHWLRFSGSMFLVFTSRWSPLTNIHSLIPALLNKQNF